MKSEIIQKDTKDMKGWTIRKGTQVFIVKIAKIKNPMTQKIETFKIVKVDNGTCNTDLMPETCIKEV